MSSVNKISKSLTKFWEEATNAKIFHEYTDSKVGAATLHPVSLLRINGNLNETVAFAQKCYRPLDYRMQSHRKIRSYVFTQFQVITNLSASEAIELTIKSLQILGLRRELLNLHQDDWKSDVINAYGKGSEMRYMNMEIIQLTDFFLYNGKKISNAYEIAYGVDRIAMSFDSKESIDCANIEAEDFENFLCIHGEMCPINLREKVTKENAVTKLNTLLEKLGNITDMEADHIYAHALYAIHLFNEIDSHMMISNICKKLYMSEIGNLMHNILNENAHKKFIKYIE